MDGSLIKAVFRIAWMHESLKGKEGMTYRILWGDRSALRGRRGGKQSNVLKRSEERGEVFREKLLYDSLCRSYADYTQI